MAPDLDAWLAQPQIRVRHRRLVSAAPDELWRAARSVTLRDARRLGRLIRLRIPGLAPDLCLDEMFRNPPFNVLIDDRHVLVSGLVGRIWTLRRDYPVLDTPEEFLNWSARGTVRVLFANWVESVDAEQAALVSETRVRAVDRRGRLGLTAVRPLISSSHQLISRDGIQAALRALAEIRDAPLPDPAGQAEPGSIEGQVDGA